MYNSIASIYASRFIISSIIGLHLLALGCPLPEPQSETGVELEAEGESGDAEPMLTETGTDPSSDTGDEGEQDSGELGEAVLLDLGPDIECGDATVQEGEQCDLWNLAYMSCLQLGYVGGTLACKDDCTFDETGCVSPGCGNGYLDDFEVCDDSPYPCWLLGYAGGGNSGMAPCLPTCTPDEGMCDPTCVWGSPGCFCWGDAECPNGYECAPNNIWGPQAPGTCQQILCADIGESCLMVECCGEFDCIDGICQLFTPPP